VLESGEQNIDVKFLERFPSFVEFRNRSKTTSDAPSGPNPDQMEELLREFAESAEKWFAERPFVTAYYHFIQDFFRPEKLQTAEWSDFQSLANHLHSFNSVALAKGNAFGRPNYPIEKYRESFNFLAHGSGSEVDRMRAFMGDKEAYASKYLGNSVVSELVGQLFADRFVFMNRRDIEAAEFLGIQPIYERGDDFPTRFSKFNVALEQLFDAYRQVVGSRTEVPIGLEVDQFLSWLYEIKISKRPPAPASSVTAGKQIWVFAPGPKARFWDECRAGSIAVYGADLLGPLDAYGSKDEILQRLKVVYPTEKGKEPTNDALAAWEFCRVMKEGDLVIAKKGNRMIVGVGVVSGPYRHDSTRTEYPNVRDIEWTHEGEWPLPDGESFATKTLTNITRYRDFVAKIMSVVGIDTSETPLESEPRHFWLNCAPDVWNETAERHMPLSEYPIGSEEGFTTHNDKGNKRRVYECFLAAKPGDLVIGYETTPVQKVTTLLEVSQGVHEEEGEGECIRVKVIEQLDKPRTLQELREIPALADCDPVKGAHQGSIFQLTKAEYDAILGKTLIGDVEASEPEPVKEVYTIEDALDGLFVEEANFSEWLKQWKIGKNLIIQGAPGVGKTFVARRLAYALMQEEDPQRVAFVQFHQSYGYEDFVQGIKPVRVKEGELTKTVFDLRNGVFYEFCIQAKGDPRPRVFIIDEINRGNLSRILGELLMLIEVDKRGEEHALRLAYQEEGQSFFVPDNVYILGMMNTADRSLAVVDYALRRRFRFATLEPAFERESFREHLSEVCGEELADRIILRLRRLNEDIAKDTANLGPGFCLGHSYFCRVQNVEDYREVIRFQIAPLLREYWFDQPRKADDRIQELLSI
jgi:5-methylcytosine-specific restriction protein B